ncbi:hypothetical protein U1Q18_030810 [Sarracenia purpurea var. burkii]
MMKVMVLRISPIPLASLKIQFAIITEITKKKTSYSVETKGSDTVTDFEFSKIVIEKREDRTGESNDEPSSTHEIRSESSGKYVVEDERAASSNIDDDLLQMIGPHSQLLKLDAQPWETSSPPEGEKYPPINRSEPLPEKAPVDMPTIGKFIRFYDTFVIVSMLHLLYL